MNLTWCTCVYMLAGSCRSGTIDIYQYTTLKVARKAFSIRVVWNPVCCHSNKNVRLILRSTSSRMILPRIKHFWFKLAKISLFIISDQSSVELMTSSLSKFAYFKNLNICSSGTKRGIENSKQHFSSGTDYLFMF